jgi:hypothetical protein
MLIHEWRNDCAVQPPELIISGHCRLFDGSVARTKRWLDRASLGSPSSGQPQRGGEPELYIDLKILDTCMTVGYRAGIVRRKTATDMARMPDMPGAIVV